jgi:MOSC domain-containing protein YiiM
VLRNNFGTVLELFISIKSLGKENKNEIILESDGVYGDKFFAKNINRSVLLASLDSYSLAKENGVNIKYGSLGENILMDINPYSLKIGDQISIGETTLEITQHCTICNSLAKVDAKLPKILKSDRGIFAKTLKSGKIKKGDRVTITNKEQQ